MDTARYHSHSRGANPQTSKKHDSFIGKPSFLHSKSGSNCTPSEARASLGRCKDAFGAVALDAIVVCIDVLGCDPWDPAAAAMDSALSTASSGPQELGNHLQHRWTIVGFMCGPSNAYTMFYHIHDLVGVGGPYVIHMPPQWLMSIQNIKQNEQSSTNAMANHFKHHYLFRH